MNQFLKSPTFLKNGAVFIADSHYSHKNEDLYYLLLKLQKDTNVTQIFLVGDIFHLLLDFKYLIEYNQKVINLIDEISLNKEVYYFEGNHDFCLDGIFKNLKVLKELKKDGICINHGDIYVKDKFYKFYTKFIRNKFTMNIVNIFTLNFINNWMFKKILNKKIKCENFDFDSLAKQKLKFYKDCKLIIEGHYHQDKTYKNYINLPSLYCQKSYIQFINSQFIERFIKK